MIFKKFGLSILILLTCTTYSQPSIQWTKCYGGTSGEGAHSIILTSDSGYLVIGATSSNDSDVVGAYCVYDSASGNCVPYRDAWVIKLDYSGNLLWQKCFGGYGTDEGISAVEVNGGYVNAISTGSTDGDVTNNNGETDFWIVKIDFLGNIIWQYNYGGLLEEYVYGMTKTIDGGFLISGSEISFDGGDVSGHHGNSILAQDGWLIKLDSMGILQWQKCLGGTYGELNQYVQSDSFGNIYFISLTSSTDGDISCNINGHNIWLSKLDSTGAILWDHCYGGTGTQYIHSMKIYGDRILIAGETGSSDGDLTHNNGLSDAWILMTDTSGNIIFSQSYGGSRPDVMYSAVLTTDHRIIAVGRTNSSDFDVTMNHPSFNSSDSWIICTDTLGNLLWQNTYGGYRNEVLNSIELLPNNDFVVAGSSASANDGDITGYHGTLYGQFWIAKFDLINNVNNIRNSNLISVYPQPFSDQIHLILPTNVKNVKGFSVIIYDIQGRTIPSSITFLNNELLIFPDPSIKSGVYFLKFITENKIYDCKIVKM